MLDATRDGRQEFRFLGGRACLDFTATLGERWGRQAERLGTPHDLASWLAEAGLSEEPPAATWQDLAQAHTLREAVPDNQARMGASPARAPGLISNGLRSPAGSG